MCCKSVYSHMYNTSCFEGFKIFTPLQLGNTFFWDVTLHRWPSDSRNFGGKYCLHLQRLVGPRRILMQTLNPWKWRHCFLSKYQELLKSVIKLHISEEWIIRCALMVFRHIRKIAKKRLLASSCSPVRPSVCPPVWCSDFHEIRYLSIFIKYVYNIQVLLNSDMINLQAPEFSFKF